MPFLRSMHLRVELYLHLAIFRIPRILMIRHVLGVDALKHGSFRIIPRYHRAPSRGEPEFDAWSITFRILSPDNNNELIMDSFPSTAAIGLSIPLLLIVCN